MTTYPKAKALELRLAVKNFISFIYLVRTISEQNETVVEFTRRIFVLFEIIR